MGETTVTINKSSLFKKAVLTGTFAVSVAFSATNFISLYGTNPTIVKAAPSNGSPSAQFIKKNPKTYTKPESKYEFSFVAKGAKIQMPENIKGQNITHTSFPIEYVGNLPISPENNFVLNNEREEVDISHRIEKLSAPVVYGGQLPVGRER